MAKSSSEIAVLKAFCDDRVAFESYGTYLKGVRNLERELKLILTTIESYYGEIGGDFITREELITYYNIQYPVIRGREIMHDLINVMYQTELNGTLVQKLLEAVMEKHYASKVVGELLPTMEGDKSGNLVEVYQSIGEYIQKLSNPPKDLDELVQCDLSLADIVDTEVNYEGLHWHLPVIDQYVGKLKRKTLGVLYAFVDSGKTSFSLASCAAFAKQLADTDEAIVYAGNEEAATGLNLRLTQALLAKTKQQVVEDIGAAEEQRQELGFGNIKLYDSITTMPQVIKLMETHNPRVIFIDQATNIEMPGLKQEGVEALKTLFRAFRELSKDYDTSIVGVVQGLPKGGQNRSPESKKYLELSDIYGSNVAIQGPLDYAFGIGKITTDAAYEMHRWINVTKNKLGTGDKPKFVTMFDPHRCGWKEI